MRLLKSARKAATRAVETYRQSGSIARAATYLLRYVMRRGPAALHRLFVLRRSIVLPAPIKNERSPHLRIVLDGGIGDHVIAARYIRDLQASCGLFTFDTFSGNTQIDQWIFSDVSGFSHCYYDIQFQEEGDHDLGIFIGATLQVLGKPKISPSPLLDCVDKIRTFNEEMVDLIRDPLKSGFLAQKLQFRNVTRQTSPHYMSGIAYGGDRFPLKCDRRILSEHGLERRKYVVVHNGFDGREVTSGDRATKCYPHFDEVVRLLKQDMSGIRFVQIGTGTSTPLRQVDLDFLGKTSLPEASAVIEDALLLLDNESGMVHIASCFSVPSCVVFGPTPPDFFCYAGNVAVRPKVCGGCWWITEDWMDRCPRGMQEPVCMNTQPPSAVARAFLQLLEANNR